MNGTTNGHTTNVRQPLVTVSIDLGRLKRQLYIAALIFLFVGVFVYVLFRDRVWESTRTAEPSQSTISAQAPLIQQTMFTGNGTSGYSFSVSSARKFHLTVRGNTGSHIVINKWMGSVMYSSKRTKQRPPDFDDEVYLEPGQYVLSLIASGKLPAQAFIEIR